MHRSMVRIQAQPPAMTNLSELTETGNRSSEGSNSLDTRIISLKILAFALMGRIESLEEDVAPGGVDDLNLQNEVHRFEAELIRNALIETGGRQRRAAKLLGVKVTTLNTKIKRYAIHVNDLTNNRTTPQDHTKRHS